MQISWLHLVPALVCLFFPLDKALPEKVRLRTFDGLQTLDSSGLRKPWWWLPALWGDPIRAFAGALLLTLAFIPPDKAVGFARHLPMFLTVGILVVGVAVQMRTTREIGAALAPIGFLVGVICVLVPMKVAIPALVLGLSSIIAFRTWSAFFFMAAAGVTVIGYLFMGKNLWMLSTVALSAAPLLLSVLMQAKLAFPSRR